MGFDCTLHAVDGKQISKQFVDILLSDGPPLTATAGDVGVSKELWQATLKTLREENPGVAASAVCQLALVFASKKQAYHYERGFALCLWPELDDGLASEFPKKLTGSPEALFTGLVKAYPQLRGHFPTVFDGNYSTGTYIPAKNVSQALRWVEKQIKKFAEGDRALFDGIILVLQHCAKNKLAYWEGTDLPVPIATMKAAGSESRRVERSFGWPDHGYLPIAHREDLFVCEHRLGPGNKEARTALVNFSVWPPSIDWLQEFAIGAALASEGRIVTLASEPGKVYYLPILRERASKNSPAKILTVPKSIRIGENGFEWVDFFQDSVMSLLNFKKSVTGKRYPLLQQGDRLQEVKDLRPAQDNHKDHWGGEKMQVGVARTGSGSEVLLWSDSGYEQSKGKFQKTFQLAPGPFWNYRAQTTPGGSDGFFYLTRCLLFEAIRQSETVQHLQKVTNIMEIQPGPMGSLLLKEGNDKAGDWGKVYWPESKQFIRLKPTLVPEIPKRDLRSIHWLESRRCLLFFADKEVWFVPWEEIEDLPKSKG